MAVEITMPQLSDTMDNGTILAWLKQVGDKVERGDALAEVSTDKADLEIESFHEGTLLEIYSNVGDKVNVGTVIALIGEEGEKASAPSVSSEQTPPVVEEKVTPAPEQVSVQAPQAPVAEVSQTSVSQVTEERIKISPLAKNIAENHGVDYSNIQGSGEGGRITKKDIESKLGTTPQAEIIPAKPATPQQQPTKGLALSEQRESKGQTTEPLSTMRQAIASKMVQSTTEIPHFYVTSRVEVGELKRIKDTLKPLPQYEGVTFNHLITKAVALALKAYPRINSRYENGSIVQPQSFNVGIITAVPDGLLVPVVKNADELSLADLVAESRSLVKRARTGRPKADDLMGGTFSISNMGLFEVESFTAIINPGQGGIVAVSSTQEEALVKNGKVVPGLVMRLTLSVDHRIIDGVMAGEFLKELKRLIEEPILLLA